MNGTFTAPPPPPCCPGEVESSRQQVDVSFPGSIKPFKVGSYNQRIVECKETVIKGWDGIYELLSPPQLFPLAFEVGPGAKNSQGFGCIELWEEKRK